MSMPSVEFGMRNDLRSVLDRHLHPTPPAPPCKGGEPIGAALHTMSSQTAETAERIVGSIELHGMYGELAGFFKYPSERSDGIYGARRGMYGAGEIDDGCRMGRSG